MADRNVMDDPRVVGEWRTPSPNDFDGAVMAGLAECRELTPAALLVRRRAGRDAAIAPAAAAPAGSGAMAGQSVAVGRPRERGDDGTVHILRRLQDRIRRPP
jgi:hypothetical protein